jgi:hypothetical protein
MAPSTGFSNFDAIGADNPLEQQTLPENVDIGQNLTLQTTTNQAPSSSGFSNFDAIGANEVEEPIALEAIKNLPSSTANLALDVGEGIISLVTDLLGPGPSSTLEGLSTLISGSLKPQEDKTEFFIDEFGLKHEFQTKKVERTKEEAFAINAIKSQIFEKYGNLENLENTFRTDPASVLFDVSNIFTGAGALMKGGKVGKMLSTIGKGIDPLKGAAKLAGKGIKKAGEVLPSRIAPFRKGLDTDVLKASAREGIDLPASSLVETKGPSRIQAAFGSQKLEESLNSARDIITEKANKVAKDLPDVGLRNFGRKVVSKFEDFKDSFRETTKALYESQLTDDLKSAFKTSDELETFNTIKNIMKKNKDSLVKLKNPTINQIAKSTKGKVTPDKFKTNPVTGAKELVEKGGVVFPEINYQSLKLTRSIVGRQLKNRMDPVTTGAIKELEALYASLSNDMQSIAKKLDPVRAAKMEEASDIFSGKIREINSKLGKNLEKLEPTELLSTIIKKNKPDQIKLAKDFLGPDGSNHLSTTFIADTLKKSINKKGILDGPAIRRNMNRYGKEVLSELLTKDQISTLNTYAKKADDFNKLQGAISRGSSVAKGSQSTFLAKIIGANTAIVQGLSGDSMLLLHALIGVAGNKAASVFVNSKTGNKLFSTGLKTRGLKKKIQKASKIPEALASKKISVVSQLLAPKE